MEEARKTEQVKMVVLEAVLDITQEALVLEETEIRHQPPLVKETMEEQIHQTVREQTGVVLAAAAALGRLEVTQHLARMPLGTAATAPHLL